MATSIRQQIMTLVEARLETILISGGYNTNIGENVFEWRAAELEENELPGVIYRDRGVTTTISVGYHLHTLTLELEICVSGTSAPATLRLAIADVITAIGTDRQWSTLAEDTHPASDETIGVEHDRKKISGAVLLFAIQFVTDPFDPYTQS